MRIAVYAKNSQPHHFFWASAFVRGLERHGIKPVFYVYDNVFVPQPADLHVFWSLKPALTAQMKGKNYLILERGYIDRENYASISFNGLHGRSLLDFSNNGNERVWRKGWGFIGGNALGEKTVIAGQVPNDSALMGADIMAWAKTSAEIIESEGIRPFFRPHPLHPCRLNGVATIEGGLLEVLAQSQLMLTYNSNIGVDCWIHGVPCLATDQGSMLNAYQEWNGVCRDSYRWLNDLSYKQYNYQEFESGEAWQNVSRQILRYFSDKAGCLIN